MKLLPLLAVGILLPVYGSVPLKKTSGTSSQANPSQPSTNAAPISVIVNPFPITIANPATNLTATVIPPSKNQPIYVHLDYKPDSPSPWILALLPALIALTAGILAAIISSTILNRSQEWDFRRKKLEELFVCHTKVAKQIARKIQYILDALRDPNEHGKTAIAELEKMMNVDFGSDAEMEMLTNIYHPNLAEESEKIVELHNASTDTISLALKAYVEGKDTDELCEKLRQDIEKVEALEKAFNEQLFLESKRLNSIAAWKIWQPFTRS